MILKIKQKDAFPAFYPYAIIPSLNLPKTMTFKQKIILIQKNVRDFLAGSFFKEKLEQRAEDLVQTFENYLSSRDQVLDIGGGWGFYSAPLKKRGCHLTVLDVHKPSFQKAPVIIYSGDKMPFKGKSFNTSLLVTTLHHAEKVDDLIHDAVRVTKRFIIVVEDLYHHALGRMWTILRDQFYNFEFFGHPKNFRSQSEWTQAFEKAGCRQVYFQEVKTNLAGFSILNGIFVFQVPA